LVRGLQTVMVSGEKRMRSIRQRVGGSAKLFDERVSRTAMKRMNLGLRHDRGTKSKSRKKRCPRRSKTRAGWPNVLGGGWEDGGSVGDQVDEKNGRVASQCGEDEPSRGGSKTRDLPKLKANGRKKFRKGILARRLAGTGGRGIRSDRKKGQGV